MGRCAGLDNGEKETSVFSGVRREGDENCALLGCYTARSGNLLPTFRDNISTYSKTNHDFALLSKSHLIHTLIQDCYVRALKHVVLCVISKEISIHRIEILGQSLDGFLAQCNCEFLCTSIKQNLFLIYIVLVPSIHNTCKDRMFYYNWVIPGDMFRPLNGHPQAKLE